MLARLQKAMKEKDQGFTLIELLVVIVIIGILAAIAIPMFLSQRQKGAEAAIKSDLKSLATAQETYFVDEGTYLADDESLTEFTETEDVTVEMVYANAQTFCAKGTSTGTEAVWYYDSANGGLTETACTAPAPTT